MKIAKDSDLLIFRIIKYGLAPDHEYFSINDLARDLKVKHADVELLQHYIIEDLNRANPNHVMQRIRTIDETVKALKHPIGY